jgi:hypothetical protein
MLHRQVESVLICRSDGTQKTAWIFDLKKQNSKGTEIKGSSLAFAWNRARGCVIDTIFPIQEVPNSKIGPTKNVRGLPQSLKPGEKTGHNHLLPHGF